MLLQQAYYEAVQRGIAYLNERFGGFRGWEGEIDLDRLDMAKFEHCICGQLGLSYESDGDTKLCMSGELGFYANDDRFRECEGFRMYASYNHDNLRNEWCDAITELRQVG